MRTAESFMNGSVFVRANPVFEKTDTKECLCESQISCEVTAEVSDDLTTGSNCITSTTLSHSCKYNICLWRYLWDGETKREV